MTDPLEERQATFLAEEHSPSEETVGVIFRARLYLVTGGAENKGLEIWLVICSAFQRYVLYLRLKCNISF